MGVVEQVPSGDAPTLLVVGRREARRLAEARRQQLGFAARVERYRVVQVGVQPAVARERLNVIHRLRRKPAQGVVNVLVQGGDADLGIVDQIVGVLLPDAKAEFANAGRHMAAELDLRIPFGLEVELGHVGLQRQVQQLRRARVDVLERKRLEETPDVGVDRGPRPEGARQFQPRAEAPEALREIGRTDREEIVAEAVVERVQIRHPPTILKVRRVGVPEVRVSIDHGRRSAGRVGRLDRRQEVVRLQRDVVILIDPGQVVADARAKFVLPEVLVEVGVQDIVERRLIVGQRVGAGGGQVVLRAEGRGAIARASAVAEGWRLDVERFPVGPIVHRIAEVRNVRDLERRAETQRTGAPHGVPELRAHKRVLLGLVVVGIRRLAVVDVVRNLKRAEAVNERDVGEVVPAAGQGQAHELVCVAAVVVR